MFVIFSKMGFKQVIVCPNFSILFYIKLAVILSCVYTSYGLCSQSMEYKANTPLDPGPNALNIVLMGDSADHVRYRRDSALPDSQATQASLIASRNTTISAASSTSATNIGNVSDVTTTSSVTVTKVPGPNNTDDINRTTNMTSESTTTAIVPPAVTLTPLLGVNGSGQYHGNTSDTAKVSEPIHPDNAISDTSDDVDMSETPEKIKAEHNLTYLKYDNHTYYNSVFIVNISYFKSHWSNITNSTPEIHKVLSNSHRRATTLKLPFNFPFYGFPISEITVATGGFIYIGDHVHNWLAATQYIAPLMANFDTMLNNDSYVKLYKDDEKFTALWENVALQENRNLTFTIAVTLYKNGDIIFAYKNIAIPVPAINETDHPVKIGISDAYPMDKISLRVRTKTIYEYDRVSFKPYNITNNTIIKLVALPTCLQYNSCEDCVNHNTTFKCGWCDKVKKCSCGTDRHKQSWVLNNCDKQQILNESFCPAYSNSTISSRRNIKANPSVNSAIGGVVAVFIIVTLVSSFAAWVMYAFKNPHTRSGQLLIKYRPSQWSWRRGEARYTAATIHM